MESNNFRVTKKRTWLPKVGFLLLAFLITCSGMLPTSLGLAQERTVAVNTDHSQGTANGGVSADSSAKTKADANECPPASAMVNGSFEQGPATGDFNNTAFYFKQANFPGWDTTDDSQGEKVLEVWNYQQNTPTVARDFPAPPDGIRYAELNAFVPGMLYQDVKTVPGQELHWRLDHMGRTGVDTMQLRIGAVTANPTDTPVVQKMSDGNKAWGTYTGTYTVPAGQTETRFGFQAVSTANGVNSTGNFLDNIFLGTGPCVVAEKTVSPEGPVHAGDSLTLTYDVAVKNEGGDVAAATVFEDAIPDGTVYVPGSLRITQGPGAGPLTDDQDSDAGQFDSANNKVIVNLGDLANTNDLPNGATVEFKVKPLAESAGKTVSNQANVNYTDLLTNEEKATTSNEVDTPVLFEDPKLQSEKSFTIEQKADGNTDTEHPEPGDTLRYTIQTQNVEEHSQVVKNLTISDAIPDGLDYVPGSLTVDGTKVTDATDDDTGDFADGMATGHFGDVTDKDVHNVSFLATVSSGQSGHDIDNVATVGGDNIDTPDHPDTVVKVYPRDPKLESTKSVKDITGDPDHPVDGDVLEYTISSHNTVSEGVVNNMTIADKLPDGLDYVPGSLKVDGTTMTDAADDDAGDFTDGTVAGRFGDVTDTDVHTVTFQAKVTIGDKEHARDIQNVATVGGDNIDEPDQPAVQVHVDPKTPKLQSEKTSAIEEKLDGNIDTEHPEVGDTLRYTISTHNTVTDSLVKNMTIADAIPDGLAYVPGSLKVDGQAVTDAADDDQGSMINGQVTGQFGDVGDMDDHTVTFLVTVDLGEASHDITNTATVGGDNIPSDHPNTVVKVYPRDPKLESTKDVKNITTGDPNNTVVGDVLEYTISSQNTVSDGTVNNWTISDNLPEGLTYKPGSLKVDGQAVTDATDNDSGDFADGTVTGHLGDVTDTDVHTVTFQATVTSGESQKDIENVATVGGDNTPPDHPVAQIHVDPRIPKLKSVKSGILEKKMDGNTDPKDPEVGDTLLYTISTHNTVADSLVKNLTISDPLPKDLTYVPGSLKVDGQAVTDATDNDTGEFTHGMVEGDLGDVTDTKMHTVTFEARIKSGESQQDIQNVATVGGDNTPSDHPAVQVHVDPRVPKLQSEKSATLEKKMTGNMDAKHPEVGDTLHYTIQTHNIVADSLVKGLTISDPLPKGLKYVAGSLKVDGTSATDAKDQDMGQFVTGTVTGHLGDVTDTDVHTVTFDATVTSVQTIDNTATVSGDNVDHPDQPQAITHIVARAPALASTKTAKNVDGTQNYGVGDTIVYTIQTHNTVADSLVKGLTISDPLPKGLKYVAGSLKVDGKAVTDAIDTDAGHAAHGTVTGQLGDVTDTKMHTVTFRATITSDQGGKTITNIAKISADNIDDSQVHKINASNINDPLAPKNQVLIDPDPPLPSTGDTSNIPMDTVGALLLLAGIVGFTLMKRRKGEH